MDTTATADAASSLLLDCASINEAAATELKVQPWDFLHISLPLQPENHQNHSQQVLTSCIVQVIVRPSGNHNGLGAAGSTVGTAPEEETADISIHPLLYGFLSTSFLTLLEVSSSNGLVVGVDIDSNERKTKFFISPMPLPGAAVLLDDGMIVSDKAPLLPWSIKRITSTTQELPRGSSITLSLLYMDDEVCGSRESGNYGTLQSILCFSLEGRSLMKGTTILLTTIEGTTIIATVDDIHNSDSNAAAKDDKFGVIGDIVYRLENMEGHNLNIIQDDVIIFADANQTDSASAMVTNNNNYWQSDCPGYENLVQALLQMTSLRGAAAPSGILLTGSPQVGKTHLASCVAHQLSTTTNNENDNNTAGAVIHWVSAQDLIMQATWASESDLLDILRPPPPPTTTTTTTTTSTGQHQQNQQPLRVLVIDDLHIFGAEESTLQEDSVTVNLDPEMLVVRNAVLQIIDELTLSSKNGDAVAILGIAQSASSLPDELVRTGRLEKEIAMLPPTQSQRETILNTMIPTLMVGNNDNASKGGLAATTSRKWAEALSPVTVGCVAGDLRRVLAAAWTKATARGWDPDEDIPCPDLRWEDLQKAAQTYVPIQLENVDVCKPQSFLSVDREGGDEESQLLDPNDWARIHELSWAGFGGYPLVKKRLLRTVVGPWRRFLKLIDSKEKEVNAPLGLSPPPGVLFHGASGNGKSFAASCLASSLGLPMIKVKAADIMDKWLGGSEAIIRSLFVRARSAAPCILFFDEIDAVATNRAGGDEGGAEVMSRLLSTLLNEMDGISSDKRKHSILVVACTNRLESLDAALLRPGRLEEHILLENPDALDVHAMLQLHLSKVPLSGSTSLDDLAQELAKRHATGADVEGICHEACLRAVHRSNSSDVVLLPEDIDHALLSSRLS